VIEFKRSKVSVSEGIRQNIGNQQQHFIRPFFSNVQVLLAANDVHTDKLSGTSTREQRPGLAALLDYARQGDAIVVVGNRYHAAILAMLLPA
jgi:DNA invertase Pin-like site-specific DNA recombinase